MLTRRATIGMAVAGVAVLAALSTVSAQASADDARLTVTPAVYRSDDSSTSAQIQLVRHGWGGGGWHRGWGGGYRGWGGYGGYRGWGGYGGYGFYRPYYRPYFGIGMGPGYGYGGYGGFYGGYPGYGYGYGLGNGYGYW